MVRVPGRAGKPPAGFVRGQVKLTPSSGGGRRGRAGGASRQGRSSSTTESGPGRDTRAAGGAGADGHLFCPRLPRRAPCRPAGPACTRPAHDSPRLRPPGGRRRASRGFGQGGVGADRAAGRGETGRPACRPRGWRTIASRAWAEENARDSARVRPPCRVPRARRPGGGERLPARWGRLSQLAPGERERRFGLRPMFRRRVPRATQVDGTDRGEVRGGRKAEKKGARRGRSPPSPSRQRAGATGDQRHVGRNAGRQTGRARPGRREGKRRTKGGREGEGPADGGGSRGRDRGSRRLRRRTPTEDGRRD